MVGAKAKVIEALQSILLVSQVVWEVLLVAPEILFGWVLVKMAKAQEQNQLRGDGC